VRNNNDDEEMEREELEELESASFYIIEIRGLEPVKKYSKIRKYSKERKCKLCGAKLSIYNPDDKCWPCQRKSL